MLPHILKLLPLGALGLDAVGNPNSTLGQMRFNLNGAALMLGGFSRLLSFFIHRSRH